MHRIRGLSLVALFMLSGCNKQESAVELPLVLSVPYEEGWYSRMDLTRGYLLMSKVVKPDTKRNVLKLIRIPLKEPAHRDSFSCEIDEVSSLRCGLYPSLDYIQEDKFLFSVPVGDTSEMLRFGHIYGSISDTFTGSDFGFELRNRGQLIYIVDFNSPKPQTIALISGQVHDFEFPYLLVGTGFKYGRLGVVNVPDSIDFCKSEFFVVDVSSLEIVTRISVPEYRFDPWSYWGNNHIELTCDGRLIINLDTTTRTPYSDVYIFEKDMMMREIDYDSIIHSVIGSRGDLIDKLKIPRYSALEALLLQPLIHTRALAVGRRELTVQDLKSGEVSRMKSLMPYGVFKRDVGTYLDNEGDAIFLLRDFPYLTYLPVSFVQVPIVTDLASPPQEILGFSRINPRYPFREWTLSPQKRWLLVYFRDRKYELREAILFPTQVLSDESLLAEYKSFLTFPFDDWFFEFEFVPGEEWALVTSAHPGRIPTLYHCANQKNPIPLLASDENELKEAFFSPDGRYVGYVCRIKDKEGYWVQVRELPSIH
ncbi:hypothetical protein JXM67_13500 [candidate division WOR-3 bacterium]|nr:hypothetical protein [candidate division WOR-3 bacterium]